ncbi:MAG: carotenoid 1,2-hydratase [Pseudomonadota bacterium]
MRAIFSTALTLCLLLSHISLKAAPPAYPMVIPGHALEFPRDFGAHPDYRTEWWYATGWLKTADGKPLGFQVTFFRSRVNIDANNPSTFAPKQLVFAHAALSDPARRRLLHDQRIARAAFDLAGTKENDTDAWIDDWHFQRTNEKYSAQIRSNEFALQLSFTPTQPLLLQGDQGFSQKGPKLEQASYYYSEPHLQVNGTVTRNGKQEPVTGTAWLDHEWSTAYLAEGAAGWDWTGINFDDGGALMAFQIRGKDGSIVWAAGTRRDRYGKLERYLPSAVRFEPLRYWVSPHTNTRYPVAMRVHAGAMTLDLEPLMDDQELDSQASTGAVYWEGAVTAAQDGAFVGRGYLELTGYFKALKF